jgi:acylphosphatase
MKQLHIWVSGFVQGVGYRAFTRHESRRRKLTGWVKNLPDGRVEAVMQGPEHKLKEMIQACEKGSYFAQVRNIVVEWEESPEVFKEFTIIRK